MQWTQELDTHLAHLWGEGLTGQQIAKRIGGVTRSSILARARRIGLPPRVSEESKASTRPKRKAPKFNFATAATKSKPRPVLAPEPYVARETIVTAEHERLSFEALEAFDSRCRYAHGDTPPYSFCGARAVPGKSWCETHLHAVFGTKPAQLSGNPGELKQPQNLRELEAVE